MADLFCRCRSCRRRVIFTAYSRAMFPIHQAYTERYVPLLCTWEVSIGWGHIVSQICKYGREIDETAEAVGIVELIMR